VRRSNLRPIPEHLYAPPQEGMSIIIYSLDVFSELKSRIETRYEKVLMFLRSSRKSGRQVTDEEKKT
jgi:hypothetical protein